MSTGAEQVASLSLLTEEQTEEIKDITVEAMQLLGKQVEVATSVVEMVADMMEDDAVIAEIADPFRKELAQHIAMFALLDIAVAKQRARVAAKVTEFGLVT